MMSVPGANEYCRYRAPSGVRSRTPTFGAV